MSRIGLLGGSFNPAHAGHRHVSRLALDALGLDEIWWMVSPGNALKRASEQAELLTRMAGALALHPGARARVTAPVPAAVSNRATGEKDAARRAVSAA